MTQQRKTYSREFKREAIRLWQTSGMSAREAALGARLSQPGSLRASLSLEAIVP